MIRALISSSTFPIRLDDALPRFVYDLAAALARHSQVTALVPDAPGARRRQQMGGVDVRRFTYFLPRSRQTLAYGHGMRNNLRGSLLCKLQPLPFVAAQVRATRALVREQRIQVVNSHWMVPQGLSTALARGSRPRFRHLLSVHAADIYLLRTLPFGSALARFIIGRTDFVFADGSHVRDSLDALIGRSANAVLQPMGVHVDLFALGPGIDERRFDDGYLLFFGRLTEKKGVVYLLRAMPRVLERHPGLGLVVIGYGSDEQRLRREAQQLGIAPAVVFLGRQPHAEIGRYLRSARLAVVPSIVDSNGETEGMPTVVAEAMAAGTRVVGSAVDGIPDLIRHGENGWLCRQQDAEDLAAKILDGLADPASSEVPRRARETAGGLDWSHVAARYLEVFERLVG